MTLEIPNVGGMETIWPLHSWIWWIWPLVEMQTVRHVDALAQQPECLWASMQCEKWQQQQPLQQEQQQQQQQ
jgi:hypothetical protein